MRFCSRCGRDLPETQFYANQYLCKDCQKLNSRVRARAMRELARKFPLDFEEIYKDEWTKEVVTVSHRRRGRG